MFLEILGVEVVFSRFQHALKTAYARRIKLKSRVHD